MEQTVAHAWVKSLRAGPIHRHRNLAWIFLSRPGTSVTPSQYLSAAEALERNQLRVEETGTVHQLRVTNTCQQPILVPAGTYFLGGKQDRMSVVSVVVPPGVSLELPTRCIEQGRWHGSSREFTIPKVGGATLSTISSGSQALTQAEVWDTVAESIADVSAASESSRLGDAYEQTEDARADYAAHFTLPKAGEDVVGLFCFCQGNGGEKHTTLDLFATPELFCNSASALRDAVAFSATMFSSRRGKGEELPDDEWIRGQVAAHEAACIRVKEGDWRQETISKSLGLLRTHTAQNGATTAVLEDEEGIVHAIARRTWIT